MKKISDKIPICLLCQEVIERKTQEIGIELEGKEVTICIGCYFEAKL